MTSKQRELFAKRRKALFEMNRRGRERRRIGEDTFRFRAKRFLNKLINICTVVIAYEASRSAMY